MAFDFVSSRIQGDNVAYVSKDEGEIYYYSELLGLDETRGHDVHSLDYEPVPHRDVLELGRELAFDFVDERLPEQYAAVRDFYADEETAESRFRDTLEAHGLAGEWDEYKTAKIEATLREWCLYKNIELDA